MNKEIMNKWEIEMIVNQFPEIKQVKEQRMKEYALRDMINHTAKAFPRLDMVQPGEIIIRLLDEIYDVYCGNKEEVNVIEIFREAVINDCVKDADRLLRHTLRENQERGGLIREIIPVYYGEFYDDLKELNDEISGELRILNQSFDSSDELVYSLVKEPCEWLMVNNSGSEFIKKLYDKEDVSAVIDGIEFVNAIFTYEDEIQDFLENKISEEESLKRVAFDLFEPKECFYNILKLDYNTIKGLIYMSGDKWSKQEFISNCLEVINKCKEQEEVIERG